MMQHFMKDLSNQVDHLYNNNQLQSNNSKLPSSSNNLVRDNNSNNLAPEINSKTQTMKGTITTMEEMILMQEHLEMEMETKKVPRLNEKEN